MYLRSVLLVLAAYCVSAVPYKEAYDDDVTALLNDVMSKMDFNYRDGEKTAHAPKPIGHQYVSGGAGEGSQHLTPGGGIPNPHEVKTDANLPAYCDPPNPCPVGVTEDQGCMTDVADTAEFSRQYQEDQDCLCDAEHMFKCHKEADNGQMFGGIPYLTEDNLVAKKDVPTDHLINRDNFNPFLDGEHLPIIAKKGVLMP